MPPRVRPSPAHPPSSSARRLAQLLPEPGYANAMGALRLSSRLSSGTDPCRRDKHRERESPAVAGLSEEPSIGLEPGRRRNPVQCIERSSQVGLLARAAATPRGEHPISSYGSSRINQAFCLHHDSQEVLWASRGVHVCWWPVRRDSMVRKGSSSANRPGQRRQRGGTHRRAVRGGLAGTSGYSLSSTSLRFPDRPLALSPMRSALSGIQWPRG
jgi:hypothetical protein